MQTRIVFFILQLFQISSGFFDPADIVNNSHYSSLSHLFTDFPYNYGIARLNADGSVDASFASPIPVPIPNPSSSLIPGIIYSIAVQADGKIVIGGIIVKSYNPTLVITPVARLNQNGSFDSTFANVAGNTVVKVAVQPDGKILLAGLFTTINGVGSNYIARLNANGSLDPSFKIGTGASRPIFALSLQSDGKILIGGIFFSFNNVSRNQVARLNADGSLDMTFDTVNNSFGLGTIHSVSALSGGRVLVGGEFSGFSFFGGNDSIRVLNADGSTDSSVRFSTTALGGVRAIAVQPDGKIIVGGNFNRPGSNSIDQVFRLNPDGSIDTSFGGSPPSLRSSSSGQVNSIIIQPDRKIILAGFNLFVNSGNFVSISNIVRLNADGTSDTSFVPGVRATIPLGQGINAAALQSDGKIIVVWGYNQPNGFPTGGIARLNSDGSLDTTFNYTLPNSFFNSVVIQPDGKILVGGPFNFGFVNSQTGNVSYNGVVRLNADGSRDTTFVPATTSNFETGRVTEVSALALQTDGEILVGGRIYAGGSTTAAGIARLNQNGALDTAFNLSAISGVADIARVEDIFPLPNGKILIGGLFDRIGSSTQNNIARLNADGSVDNSFITTTDNTIYKIVTQADGKVLIGGDFETVNGVVCTSLARLLSEPFARRTKFDFDGDGKADISVYRPSSGVWYLLNSQNGFTAAQFGASTDKPVVGDYDGDGKADYAVFRPSNGTWYRLNSSNGQFVGMQFGISTDLPTPADYDGDGKTDIAVFRNGIWYLQQSANGFTGVQFGVNTDKPVPNVFIQ